ncbi:lasso peptide biosynthesis B2 protein [Paenibacillus cellulositrophicus]|uniref:lasso peptide biosynthesis B2 protein n=1 Tax=Paenibacillus cellulositrophicus TaxID=562959 RepID=UPI00203B4775|nr:lasso peptide biosynthesis B2 protein [Paenibacillus cellulositrophicus]MCM2996931.1 lasso peptide biosynthesis B2 protein [Paenibacillus cellulositrophicus]
MKLIRDFQNYWYVFRFAIGLMAIRKTIKQKLYLNNQYATTNLSKRSSILEEKQLSEILNIAEKICFGRAACLERSVYLHKYLTKHGHPSKLKIGVRKYPFRAHAWVEVNGRPFCDTIPNLNEFNCIFQTDVGEGEDDAS